MQQRNSGSTFNIQRQGKRFTLSKNSNSCAKGTTAITQVTNDLVKLKNNRELTAKDIRESIDPVIKSYTEAMTFFGHANQDADSIRRPNTAISLPKELYSLAKDVPKSLFGDDINPRINNIKAQQKSF